MFFEEEIERHAEIEREGRRGMESGEVLGLSLVYPFELYLHNKTYEKYHYTISFIYLCFPRGQFDVYGQSAT